ncbi:MAG: hypothetical protein MJ156_00675 [Alphaproteobacteria bacterium]|nr:hypothetical protein [Alphaproteobacteria bacterium]
MNFLKKFLVWLGALIPFSAGAIGPIAIGAIALGGGLVIGGVVANVTGPTDMTEALEFFSTCWSCQLFSEIMLTMSHLLPKVYSALGTIIIPLIFTILILFVGWRIAKDYFDNTLQDGAKVLSKFGSYAVKIVFVVALLLMPLPRLITSVFIDPAVTLGTSVQYVMPDNNDFAECMVASSVLDANNVNDQKDAFSPHLRHQLMCEVAEIHKVTGMGMATGWALLNAAFRIEHMHKVFWNAVPICFNIPMALIGLLIVVLYLFAILPVPFYFLEIFIKLSMDLIMLPLMLLAWLFDKENWAIFPQGGQTIKKMVEDTVKGVIGIAITVVFLTFSVKFIDGAFSDSGSVSALQTAFETGDSEYLIQGMLMHNDSLITVALVGVFFAMFMHYIPQLVNSLFKMKVSDKYYQTAKKDLKIMFENTKKIFTKLKK